MHRTISTLLLFLLTSIAFGEEPLQILYTARAPYMAPNASGEVTGLTADPTAYALKKARIPFKWVEVPSARQIVMIKENKARLAGLGWYKNPEREGFAKFSTPLYQDKQIAVLARKDNQKIALAKTVEQLLSNKDIVLLAKSGYSYGKFLDERIAQHQPSISLVTVENLSMILMIDACRADYMFISPEEADVAINMAKVHPEDLQLVTLPDMPPGEKRYLMFSKLVDDDTIKLISKYMDEYTSPRETKAPSRTSAPPFIQLEPSSQPFHLWDIYSTRFCTQ